MSALPIGSVILLRKRMIWTMSGQVLVTMDLTKTAHVAVKLLGMFPRGIPSPEDLATAERQAMRSPARPRDEWHEDMGPVLWWKFPIEEPPYVGGDTDDDFPDDLTHWTPLPLPIEPKAST